MMESNVLKYIVKTLVVVAILALIIIGVRRCKFAEAAIINNIII